MALVNACAYLRAWSETNEEKKIHYNLLTENLKIIYSTQLKF